MSKIHLNESGKRLLRDLKKLKTDPPSGIAAAPVNNNIYVYYRFVSLFIDMGRCNYWVGFLCRSFYR